MEVNPLLGYWTCEQGGRAEVRQTKKQGRHFYTRCGCCGLMQGTGKKRQQEIYDNTEFLSGVTVTRPSGVEEKSLSTVVAEQPTVEKTEQPKVESDFDPNEIADDEQPKVESKKSWFLPLGIFISAVGAGIWFS